MKKERTITFVLFGAAGRTRRRNATFLSAAAGRQRLDLKVGCSFSHKSFILNALREPFFVPLVGLGDVLGDRRRSQATSSRQMSLLYDLALAVLARRFESAINIIKKKPNTKVFDFVLDVEDCRAIGDLTGLDIRPARNPDEAPF